MSDTEHEGDCPARKGDGCCCMGDEAASLRAEVARLADGVQRERARCLAIVRSQPNYPDTVLGKRQQWVRDEIARRIEGGGE